MNNRDLVFCASSTDCRVARLVERGTVFFCHRHQDEETAAAEAAVRDGIIPGAVVVAKDRRNQGVVVAVNGTTATVRFDDKARGTSIEVDMSTAWLELG
jgi:hypothetical protein